MGGRQWTVEIRSINPATEPTVLAFRPDMTSQNVDCTRVVIEGRASVTGSMMARHAEFRDTSSCVSSLFLRRTNEFKFREKFLRSFLPASPRLSLVSRNDSDKRERESSSSSNHKGSDATETAPRPSRATATNAADQTAVSKP